MAHLVWERLGKVDNFIEPFGNSLAVLLRNPNGPAKNETVNDLDCYIANFWRSVKYAPDLVAEHADWPVNEVDMHARHRWLVESDEVKKLKDSIRKSPKYHDPLIAGWWCWGMCLWIGSGWCDPPAFDKANRAKHSSESNQIPFVKRNGVNSGINPLANKVPNLSSGYGKGTGVHSAKRVKHSSEWEQSPDLSNGTGAGVVCKSYDPGDASVPGGSRLQLGDAYSRGRGVHSNDSENTCKERSEFIRKWMNDLSDRLRSVRVCCGDWTRVCKSNTVTTRLGMTGVFFDPPYRMRLDSGKENRKSVYATDKGSDLDKLNGDVRNYCLERGEEKDMRIALCSYEGEGNEVLQEHGWSVIEWKSRGYGKTVAGKENSARERIFFSPGCINPEVDNYPLFNVLSEG